MDNPQTGFKCMSTVFFIISSNFVTLCEEYSFLIMFMEDFVNLVEMLLSCNTT
jgi:hypothetical protein